MQRFNLKRFVGGLALAGAVTLTGVVGFAQQGTPQDRQRDEAGRHGKHEGGKGFRGGRGGGRFGGRFFARLNLTEAQQEQMSQITARFEESTRALREQARTAGRGGRDEGFGAFDGTFNESAVRAAAQARANAHVELEVAHARLMHELYNVLTPEQKAQLAAERQQREQRRQERRSRRQLNPNQIQ
jgi:protein CpxP